MSGLLDAKGQPTLAKDIKDRLAAIDPRLGLCIIKNAMGDGKTVWAVTEKWAQNDRRRAEVQRGERDPESAFDILGFLPEDCPVDTAFDYIARRFVQLQSRDDMARYIEGIHRFNAKRKADIMAPTQELMDELIRTNARTLFKNEKGRIPRSDDTRPRGKRDEKDFTDYLHDTWTTST